MVDLVVKLNDTYTHDDIKAQNFVCNSSDDVKMIDFDPLFVKEGRNKYKLILSLIQLSLTIFYCIILTTDF